MAKEIQESGLATGNVDYYFRLRDSAGQYWNNLTSAFETYLAANIAKYGADVGSATPYNVMTELGTTGSFTGDVPASAGVYQYEVVEQAGAAPLESDTIIAAGTVDTVTVAQTGDNFVRLGAPAGDSVSADVATIQADLPTRITKNVALANFPFLMILASDDISPATGLTVTATRSIDGEAFASAANAVTEIASGWYKINLAASDLNGDTIALRFTAPTANDRNITIVTQAT